jgi:hypothetical protein
MSRCGRLQLLLSLWGLFGEGVAYGQIGQAGIVFLAVGMATIDIVEAIKRKRDSVGEDDLLERRWS